MASGLSRGERAAPASLLLVLRVAHQGWLPVAADRLQHQLDLVRGLVAGLRLAGDVKEPGLDADAALDLGLEHNAELHFHTLRDKAEILADALALGILELRAKLLDRVSNRHVLGHCAPLPVADALPTYSAARQTIPPYGRCTSQGPAAKTP